MNVFDVEFLWTNKEHVNKAVLKQYPDLYH